jgi:hypothetical protein
MPSGPQAMRIRAAPPELCRRGTMLPSMPGPGVGGDSRFGRWRRRYCGGPPLDLLQAAAATGTRCRSRILTTRIAAVCRDHHAVCGKD